MTEVLVIVVAALSVTIIALLRRDPVPVGTDQKDEENQFAAHLADPYRGRAAAELLTSPPMVVTRHGEITLGEYLKHNPYRDNVWHTVVEKFYAQAAAHTRIAPYFANVDVASLQKHFMAAIMIVTSEGLRVGTVRSMENRHARVRTPDGEPITFTVYDETVAILAQVIADELTHDRLDSRPVIEQLLRTIAPLRDAIAVTP